MHPAQVWVADEFLRGEVLQRFPGAVLVRLEERCALAGVAWRSPAFGF